MKFLKRIKQFASIFKNNSLFSSNGGFSTANEVKTPMNRL